jgi:hypothetical protein
MTDYIPHEIMTERPYSEILQELDRIKDPYEIEKHDLLALGITTAHIPDLIETILTDRYYLDEAEESVAHIPAYIALGQLKTAAAIDGLILGVQKWSSSDWFEWFTEDMPKIFASIGASAIPALTRLLQDSTQHIEARFSAVNYLETISKTDPELRSQCQQILVTQLEKFADSDPELNGNIVGSLVWEFEALDTLPLIEAAYAADRVDPSFPGSWDDVRVKFGLKKAAKIPAQLREERRLRMKQLERAFNPPDRENLEEKIKQNVVKNKDKRKQQQAARRKNRRK